MCVCVCVSVCRGLPSFFARFEPIATRFERVFHRVCLGRPRHSVVHCYRSPVHFWGRHHSSSPPGCSSPVWRVRPWHVVHLRPAAGVTGFSRALITRFLLGRARDASRPLPSFAGSPPFAATPMTEPSDETLPALRS